MVASETSTPTSTTVVVTNSGGGALDEVTEGVFFFDAVHAPGEGAYSNYRLVLVLWLGR